MSRISETFSNVSYDLFAVLENRARGSPAYSPDLRLQAISTLADCADAAKQCGVPDVANAILDHLVTSFPSYTQSEQTAIARAIIDHWPERESEMLDRSLPLLGGDLPPALYDHLQYHLNRDYLVSRTGVIYDAFDAQREIEKIRRDDTYLGLTQEERLEMKRARLNEVKKRLTIQEDGVAFLIRLLLSATQSHPDATEQELFRLVQEVSPTLQLNVWQVIEFSCAISGFVARRRAVKEWSSRYPKNNDLFRACFGQKPRGAIVVLPGGATLHFQLADPRDYRTAYRASENSSDERLAKEERRINLSGGCALKLRHIPELAHVVTIERGIRGSTRVARHEEEHQRHTVIDVNNYSLSRPYPSFDRWVYYDSKTNPHAAVNHLLEHTIGISRRMDQDEPARTEILAFYATDMIELPSIFSTLASHPLYYHPPDQSERKQIALHARSSARAVLNDVSDYDQIQARYLKRILNHVARSDIDTMIRHIYEEEYRIHLAGWVSAIQQLEDKGYTREEIHATLYPQPAHRWPRIARRKVTK